MAVELGLATRALLTVTTGGLTTRALLTVTTGGLTTQALLTVTTGGKKAKSRCFHYESFSTNNRTD